jgi:undecaprenyl-diphosphatase
VPPELASTSWSKRFVAFLLRHNWSFPLSIASFLFFVQLASETREGELAPFDRAVASWLEAKRGDWDGLMLGLTHGGGERSMTIICACTVLVLLMAKQRKAATFAAVGGAGAWLLTSGLKLLFQRARPEAVTQYLIHAPSSFSFPSGHALGSTCVVGSLVVIAHAVGLPLASRMAIAVCSSVFILGVAASRVYFGVHYASDVLAGLLAGASWVAALTGWFYPQLLPGEASFSRHRRQTDPRA